MRTRLAILVSGAAVVALASIGAAQGASDGNYRFENQHCSGSADASNLNGPNSSNDHTEVGCHNFVVSVLDNGGHEYFGMGMQQTRVGEQGTLYPVASHLPNSPGSNVHQYDVWYDFGAAGGGCKRYVYDSNHPTAAPQPSPTATSCPWMDSHAPNHFAQFNAPPDPSTGLKIYIGADDNLAGGEHDASALNNGPSDGGGSYLALDPRTVMPWLLSLVAHNPQYVLQHPLPASDGGIGLCVDGICLSAHTSRQVAYQGGGNPSTDPGCTQSATVNCANYPYQPGASHDDGASRDAAEYNPHTFDKPMKCDSDGTNMQYCGNGGMRYWNDTHGTVYDEPGVEIYNDPDPDGDSGDGIYPHPGIYVGTCGIIVGGTPKRQSFQYPKLPSPPANPQGQVILKTGC
jgi:hypothetical protein